MSKATTKRERPELRALDQIVCLLPRLGRPERIWLIDRLRSEPPGAVRAGRPLPAAGEGGR